jgi:hypothetical protein
MKAAVRESASAHASGNRAWLNGVRTFEDWQYADPSILKATVTDRGTLEDSSQSAISRTTHRRKLLILKGEMLERSIRHAWKTIVVTLAKRY